MGIINYSLLFAGIAANLLGVFAADRRRAEEGPIRWIQVYLAAAVVVDFLQFVSLRRFGQSSAQYTYAYFASDISIAILGFFILTRLVELAFAGTFMRLRGLRAGAMLLFSGVAVCSAATVFRVHRSLSVYRVSVSLEQNFAFLGMLLTLALWFGLNVMQVPGLRFRRLVLAFGVLYSSGAVAYALVMLFPSVGLVYYAPPISTLLALTLMVYTLLTPEPAQRPKRAPVAHGAPGAAGEMA